MSKNNVSGLRAVVYCRVAANNIICADENKIGIANQEAICSKYAEEHGYQIVELLTDFAPGITLERDGMSRLIQIIKSKEIDAVIVKDYDRIARNICAIDEFNNLCRKHNVKIISALLDKPYRDLLFIMNMRELVSKAYLSTKI